MISRLPLNLLKKRNLIALLREKPTIDKNQQRPNGLVGKVNRTVVR